MFRRPAATNRDSRHRNVLCQDFASAGDRFASRTNPLRCRLGPTSLTPTIRPSRKQSLPAIFRIRRLSMIPSQLPETAYAAVIALDWGDRQHAWAMSTSESSRPQTGWLINTPEAIDQWATQLAQTFPGGPIAVVPEQLRKRRGWRLSGFVPGGFEAGIHGGLVVSCLGVEERDTRRRKRRGWRLSGSLRGIRRWDSRRAGGFVFGGRRTGCPAQRAGGWRLSGCSCGIRGIG